MDSTVGIEAGPWAGNDKTALIHKLCLGVHDDLFFARVPSREAR